MKTNARIIQIIMISLITASTGFAVDCGSAEPFDGIIEKLNSGTCKGTYSIKLANDRIVPDNLPLPFQKEGIKVEGCAHSTEVKPCEYLGRIIDVVRLTQIHNQESLGIK